MQNKLHVCLQIHNILTLFLQIRGANTLYIRIGKNEKGKYACREKIYYRILMIPWSSSVIYLVDRIEKCDLRQPPKLDDNKNRDIEVKH